MVTSLQRTFTSLVHAHAGRTQEIPEDAYGAAEFGVMSYEILSITTITHFVFFELF